MMYPIVILWLLASPGDKLKTCSIWDLGKIPI